MKNAMPRGETIKSIWIFAALLFGLCSFRGYAQDGLVGWNEIRSSPDRCIGRQALLAGTIEYRDPARQSFRLKQGSDTVEVLCGQLALEQQNRVLREKVLPQVSVLVSGKVARLNSRPNSVCVLAGQVLVISKESVAEIQRRAREQGYIEGPAVSGQDQSIPSRAAPSPARKRPSRENSLERPAEPLADFGDRRAAYGGVERILLPLLGMLVLLTTIWVGFDAQANKITLRNGPYGVQNGALAWVVVCLVLWIVVFPYYLVRRSTAFREGAQKLPAPLPSGATSPHLPGAGVAPPNQGITATPNPTLTPSITPKPDTPWHYVDQSKTFGPMQEAYLHVLVKGGQLGGTSILVWQQGMDGWWFYDEVFTKQPQVSRRPVPANAPPLPASCPTVAAPAPPQRPAEIADISGMSQQPRFIKGACQQCGGHLEFNALNKGQTIDCPHCKTQTMLLEIPAPGSSRTLPKGKPLPRGIPLGRQGSGTPGAT